MDKIELFTIGHSNQSTEQLIELLQSHQIKALVDIRRFPNSRKLPHFNRESLSAALKKNGIDYEWIEKLGGRRPKRKDFVSPKRVLAQLRQLFAMIHNRQDYHSETDFRNELENQGLELWTAAMHRAPKTKEAQNLAKWFRKHGDEYIRFITTPGIEPTNNLAEQAIRFVVLDRRVTQGTRGEAGRNWCERIWTVIATCAQHGRDVFRFLTQSVQALLANTPPPSLLPNPTF